MTALKRQDLLLELTLAICPVAEMRLVALQVAASWALRRALGKVDVSGSQVGIDALSWSVRYGDSAL